MPTIVNALDVLGPVAERPPRARFYIRPPPPLFGEPTQPGGASLQLMQVILRFAANRDRDAAFLLARVKQ